MARRSQGSVGILPAGALGVAFFHHLTRGGTARLGRVCFLEREGSASARALREGGILRLGLNGETRLVSDPSIWGCDLLSCQAGGIPEIVLVCTQPDQLLEVISTAVRLLEKGTGAGSLDTAIEEWPAFVLCSNGVYFQRVRQFLLERLEEATLFGRLPDLWPSAMPKIVGKLLRGVTIQTGQREGSGSGAVYRPGPSGRTRIAGGDPAVRTRCVEILRAMGGWFESADAAPTRVEFDKALVNLSVNLLGQLAAVDEKGGFRLLTIREILEKRARDDMRELVARVVEVGRAVHAYGASDDFDTILAETLESCTQHLEHVPSSLQWIDQQLRQGRLEPRLTPTERWLMDPLIRYAHAAGLEDAAHYFEALTARIEERLALASGSQDASVP